MCARADSIAKLLRKANGKGILPKIFQPKSIPSDQSLAPKYACWIYMSRWCERLYQVPTGTTDPFGSIAELFGGQGFDKDGD